MSHISASPIFRVFLVAVVLLLIAALAACQANRGASGATAEAPQAAPGSTPAPTEPAADSDYWPTEDWRTADPARHGVDGKRLAAMMDYVKLKGLDIRGVVVVRDGYVVFEQYPSGLGPGSRGEVYSVTKSVASTLVGIARRKGLLTDLDAKIVALLPGDYENMNDRKRAMTLEDVLTMRSGLAWTDDDATLERVLRLARPTAIHARPADGGRAGNRVQLLLGLLAPAHDARC